MNKSMMTGLVVGAVVVTAGAAMAGFKGRDATPDHAEVLAVTPVTETVRTPREVCSDHAVTRQAPVKDERRITGTVSGAVIGGVLGNQVGGGSGKKLATVAGAAAGGYAGNQIQKNMQENKTVTTMETRCETVYDKSEKEIGFDVRYRLGEQEGVVRMDHRPGDRIPAPNGQLAIS
jgi:uncharacterized protein YcfJ